MDSVRILAFVCSASSRKCCPNLGSNQERGSKMTNITARLELLEARVWALEGMVDRLNTTASLRPQAEHALPVVSDAAQVSPLVVDQPHRSET